MNDLEKLYEEKKACNVCPLRGGCTQVVTGAGQMNRPILMIIAEAPGFDEDQKGEPFVGQAGRLLREVLRSTLVLNRENTLISNVLGCRPPANKFPTKKSIPETCVQRWLHKEIALAKPERMLLLGSQALKYVAGLDGITSIRGQWLNINRIRTKATYHPSYILRCDSTGMLGPGQIFEIDIRDVADEVKKIEEQRKAATK